MAASTQLYPIVIQPISEPPFQCAGNGLTYKGHTRTPVSVLRSWFVSRKRKNAKDSTCSKAKSWWHAQLCLYGLPIPKASVKLAQLREKLVSAIKEGLCDSIPPQIQEIENRLNERFLSENASAREKIRFQPRRSKDTDFAIGDPSHGFSLSKFGPDGPSCLQPDYIDGDGHSFDDSEDHFDDSDNSFDDGDDRFDDKEGLTCGKKRKTKQVGKSASSFANNKDKGIEGKWCIHCQYIEEQWEAAKNLSFYIARKKSGGLVGKFDFRVISGVIKFDKASVKPEKAGNGERLKFRWCGVDCGTGEILYLDEEQHGWVSLIKGGNFKGQFEFMGTHGMSGSKVGEASLSDIDEGWEEYGYEAHESTRIGRW